MAGASAITAQSAQAEISMVKGAYYRRTGTLRPDSAAEVEQLRSRAVEHGLLLADEILDDRLF